MVLQVPATMFNAFSLAMTQRVCKVHLDVLHLSAIVTAGLVKTSVCNMLPINNVGIYFRYVFIFGCCARQGASIEKSTPFVYMVFNVLATAGHASSLALAQRV